MTKPAKFSVVAAVLTGLVFGAFAKDSLIDRSSAQSSSERETGRYRTERIGEYGVLLIDTKTGRCWKKTFTGYKAGIGGWQEESPEWAVKAAP